MRYCFLLDCFYYFYLLYFIHLFSGVDILVEVRGQLAGVGFPSVLWLWGSWAKVFMLASERAPLSTELSRWLAVNWLLKKCCNDNDLWFHLTLIHRSTCLIFSTYYKTFSTSISIYIPPGIYENWGFLCTHLLYL